MAENEGQELRELAKLAATSKRAIDLILVQMLSRLEARLEGVEKVSKESYEEVFGGSGGRVGLAEQMRNQIKNWTIVLAIVSAILGSWTWIYEKVLGIGRKPVFGNELQEKWFRESSRRVRLMNPKTGQVETFYAIEERKDQ